MLKKVLKAIFKKSFWTSMSYYRYYNKLSIIDKTILLESDHGSKIEGNMFYILKHLVFSEYYSDYKIYVVVTSKSKKKIKNLLCSYNIFNVKLVDINSLKYYKLVSCVKYLFNDTTFLPFFIKKDGQIYVNTWHGTPLKTLGKKVKNDFVGIGNVQRNFMISDYLLYPNEFTKKHLIEDYMISNISNAKTILLGYPRNEVFYDKETSSSIRKKLNIENKKVYAYMPTWRGLVNKVDENASILLQHYLDEIDSQLNDDEVMYVNLHPMAKNDINFKKFKKIVEFPSNYETYDFLNATDALITDYSSVFFDYAITRKKIVLFAYDEEEYLADRGMYIDMNSLPFPKVDNTQKLMKELRSKVNYDDLKFLNEYNKYDCDDASKKLCDRVILNKDVFLHEKKIERNNKENLLIYTGNLSKNGITTSIVNILNTIDLSKYNYYLTFNARSVNKHKDVLLTIPDEINYIPSVGKMNMNFISKVIFVLFHFKKMSFDFYFKLMKKYYELDIKRLYGDAKFDNVIHFSGYDYKKLLTFSLMDSNRVVFVHNNMVEEIKTKKNQRRKVLEYCYPRYDTVALVSDDLHESTKILSKGNDSNFKVVRNIIQYENVIEKSKQDVVLDEDTLLNVEYDKLMEILNSKSKKFINIGRYSKEKGHERLIDSFYEIWKNNKDIYLIIIGGYGNDYDAIVSKVASLKCNNHIVLIRSISNPFPILKRCDYFVLSSFYEGFGLVLAEADILNIPVISTDICGPKSFMLQNGGTLVTNSKDGIVDGMKKMLNDEIKPMNVDYAKYNELAIKEFESLMK